MFDLDSVSVDMLPEFPGSTLALLEYLNKEMRYPKAAWKQGVAGEVVARFVITADGHVDEVEVVLPLTPFAMTRWSGRWRRCRNGLLAYALGGACQWAAP